MAPTQQSPDQEARSARNRGRMRFALCAACSLLVGAGGHARAEQRAAKADSRRPDVVATIGDATVTSEQLEELAKEALARIRSEEYTVKRRLLEELITKRLLEKEAAARRISVDQLEEQEIEGKILPVTDDQTRAVYESNRARFQGKAEAAALAEIAADLRRFRLNEARGRLMASLRDKTGVSVLLRPPRVSVGEGDSPPAGPKDAPVTIVEFSDFQCPACMRALPSIKRLLQRYPGRLRLVFRNFPLPMHPQAPKAAEAAACAHEQGRFWEMHDRLFASQQALQVPDLKRHAVDLGLDGVRFDACLDSGKHHAAWKADLEAGRRLGVNGTPTFFVNGRMLHGVPTYQDFSAVVEEELAVAGAAASK